ncbi:nucleoside deaminase [Deltaproteobacteria bacterium Smac51]|nr:nucleoside deaminase [Deltaproteobacteria bacterium Smac51]
MNRDEAFFHRMMDIIENDIVPLTLRGVKMGAKVFGAALITRRDLNLVVASSNHEANSPLWHGEVFAIKEFYELQNHPLPDECLMLATHQPCCMCASAIAWGGFPEVWYLFGYDQTNEDFNIPHDQKMIQDIFKTKEPNPDNSYYTMKPLMGLVPEMKDQAAANKRYEAVKARYAELSAIYQNSEKTMALS